MTIEMSLNEAINNYPKLVGELDYICYKYNRERTPEVTPDRWKLIFGNRVDILEPRYQAEYSKQEAING